MEIATPLAVRSVKAVSAGIGRSLRIRGFVSTGDGSWRRYGDPIQSVRVQPVATPHPGWAAFQIILGRSRDPGLALWDLVPGRERGAAWRLTPDSSVRAVVSDVVEALERWGLPYLDGDDGVTPTAAVRISALVS